MAATVSKNKSPSDGSRPSNWVRQWAGVNCVSRGFITGRGTLPIGTTFGKELTNDAKNTADGGDVNASRRGA
ncbi:hypothetical protein Mycsm_06672 (plasmid) [Mycobacterium sp. JS623]|nr:hypothetical protein Mycsm_06672 [Mycobacterium sp. JS623]